MYIETACGGRENDFEAVLVLVEALRVLLEAVTVFAGASRVLVEAVRVIIEAMGLLVDAVRVLLEIMREQVGTGCVNPLVGVRVLLEA